jgi:hypothetical protein
MWDRPVRRQVPVQNKMYGQCKARLGDGVHVVQEITRNRGDMIRLCDSGVNSKAESELLIQVCLYVESGRPR